MTKGLQALLLSLGERAMELVSELDSITRMVTRPTGPVDFNEEVRHFKVTLISWALNQTQGNQVKAAQLLGLKHGTLHSMIVRYKLNGNAGGRRSRPPRGGQPR